MAAAEAAASAAGEVYVGGDGGGGVTMMHIEEETDGYDEGGGGGAVGPGLFDDDNDGGGGSWPGAASAGGGLLPSNRGDERAHEEAHRRRAEQAREKERRQRASDPTNWSNWRLFFGILSARGGTRRSELADHLASRVLPEALAHRDEEDGNHTRAVLLVHKFWAWNREIVTAMAAVVIVAFALVVEYQFRRERDIASLVPALRDGDGTRPFDPSSQIAASSAGTEWFHPEVECPAPSDSGAVKMYRWLRPVSPETLGNLSLGNRFVQTGATAEALSASGTVDPCFPEVVRASFPIASGMAAPLYFSQEQLETSLFAPTPGTGRQIRRVSDTDVMTHVGRMEIHETMSLSRQVAAPDADCLCAWQIGFVDVPAVWTSRDQVYPYYNVAYREVGDARDLVRDPSSTGPLDSVHSMRFYHAEIDADYDSVRLRSGVIVPDAPEAAASGGDKGKGEAAGAGALGEAVRGALGERAAAAVERIPARKIASWWSRATSKVAGHVGSLVGTAAGRLSAAAGLSDGGGGGGTGENATQPGNGTAREQGAEAHEDTHARLFKYYSARMEGVRVAGADAYCVQFCIRPFRDYSSGFGPA